MTSDSPNRAMAPSVSAHGVTLRQLDLIQRFEADFNAVDEHLRRELPKAVNTPFKDRVRLYESQLGTWSFADLLLRAADVRNLLAHGRTAPYEYAAIPTRSIARELSRCRDALLHPEHVDQRYLREVVRVSPDDSLTSVLRLVNEHDFSQFPVYIGDKCRGLLTENGITRWLAANLASGTSTMDLERATVGAALRKEEAPRNYRFVRPDKPVDHVRAMFVKEANLEAVLISETGTKAERPIGIVTRWEIAGLG